MVYLVGEFNRGDNSAWPMSNNGSNTWVRTARLRVGGQIGGGVPGAYQYKFYYPGIIVWPNDPLNPYVSGPPYDNSILYARDPTIYHFLPNQRTGIVRTSTPVISAHLYPKVETSIDTGSIVLKVGNNTYSNIGSAYDFSTQRFSFRIPDLLPNGIHKAYLSAGSNIDSVSITVQAGFIQITTLGNFTTRNPSRRIYGSVEDTTLNSVSIIQNGTDTMRVDVRGGNYSLLVTLKEGLNSFRALARDSMGADRISDSISFTYVVNHAPTAKITFSATENQIILDANSSTDPDSNQANALTFVWGVDPNNPGPVPGIHGSPQRQITIAQPTTPGEYFFTLIATDPNGNRDTTRNYFTLLKDLTFQNTTLATVPQWVKWGRVYELFFKSLTLQGTINAALPFLPYFKSLGVNILWVMPVMENAYPINNNVGPGYNIKNFYKVAPEYGTNEDFKNFVRQAHQHGLKVILDVTPNHTSFLHPFAQEARLFKENSPYWNFYQHVEIPHFTNNLGQYSTPDGFYYYNGWDQLFNYDWSDIDAQYYMTEVYKWWIKEFNIDGYRYDVYWGPRRRYGEQNVGVKLRQALRQIKPDIYLLAEDDGVGVGTEVIYADRNGGADSGYDWQMYGDAIRPLYSRGIDNLHHKVFNNNFFPGPNASFLRFLENHDEERIAYLYGSYERTIPPSTVIFTAPGMPMIYSGQEVGMGPGIGDFYRRTRGVINWNAGGRSVLLPHYQKLAHIRGQFPAFSTQRFTRIPSGSSTVYTYSRPFAGQDGIVAVSISGNPEPVSITLNSTNLATTIQDGKTYYATDVYNDTSYTLHFSGGSATLTFTFRPYGSAVFVVSDSIVKLEMPLLVSVKTPQIQAGIPTSLVFHQNFPNPFNPNTRFRFELPYTTGHVVLRIYNLLGEEIAVLLDDTRSAGIHTVEWNGLTSRGFQAGSGVYFARLEYGGKAVTQKIVLVR